MSRFAESMMLALGDVDDDAQQDGTLPIEFSDDDLSKQLLRGVPAYEIVSGAGKHWEANSQGQQIVSWAFSAPVKQITMFVSHSWKASRFLKWLSLLGFLNGKSAAFASTVAALITALVEIRCGVILGVHSETYLGKYTTITQSMTPFAVGGTVGMIFFFAGQHLRRPLEGFCLEPQSAFLDKLVIHQDDPELKKRGIHLLGAFIRTSDTFLVLWSEEYLTRLWCSYEVAVFAYLKYVFDCPVRIEVWPLPFAAIMIAKTAKMLLQGLFTACVMGHTDNRTEETALLFVVNVVGNAFLATAMSTLGREHSALERQTKSYDLRAAECFAESDREIVEAAITAWFDPYTRNRDEAVLKFNRFVQEDLYVAVGASFNRGGRINAGAALWIVLLNVFFDTFGCATYTKMLPFDYWLANFQNIFSDLAMGMLSLAWQFNTTCWIDRQFRGHGTHSPLPAAGSDVPPASSISSPLRQCGILCLQSFACVCIDVAYVQCSCVTFVLTPACLVLLDLLIILLAVHQYR